MTSFTDCLGTSFTLSPLVGGGGGFGDGRGREADFSTALRTMRLCAASIEMTVLDCWERVQTTAKAKALGLVEFL
jgi:hypothetical protein